MRWRGALERGVVVHALLTMRAKGGRKRLRKLWDALEEMGAVVSWYADPVVKYHAKYLVADDGPALVTTLNPTRKCFTRTWDAVLVTHDEPVVQSLLHLFHADAAGRAPLARPPVQPAPDRRSGARAAGRARADRRRPAQHPHPRPQAVGSRCRRAAARAACGGGHGLGARRVAGRARSSPMASS